MEKFEIQIGAEQRKLIIEPVQDEINEEATAKSFKIFAEEIDAEWLKDRDNQDVPAGNYIGQISVTSEKVFTFEGNDDLNGDDLLSVATQITLYRQNNI